MATDISKLGVKTKWQDLTEGMIVAGAGTSKDFHTGEWTSVKPEFIEDKCKQCLLCVPVCPDSCIPVKDMKRGAFDYLCKSMSVRCNYDGRSEIRWQEKEIVYQEMKQ